MSNTSSLFVGRKTELEYFQMVLAQSSFSSKIEGDAARIFRSRLFLPYGIGGIGKTELAKQCLRVAQDAGWKTIAIDWDRTDCRPIEPQDLMNTIANSLRDFAGEKSIATYLNDFKRATPVRDKVHRYRAEHPEEWQKLVSFAQSATAAMPDLQTKAIAAAATATLSVGPQVLAKAYDLLVDQMVERQALKDANDALLFKNADSLLAHHLVESIKDIAANSPLVFLLDTGEVLSLELEEFLRDLIVCPTIEQGTSLIFIVSGRYDQYREREIEDRSGGRRRVKGYADRLTDPPPVAWQLSQFTDPEVANYIQANGIKTSPELVNYVQQVARGVPVALQLLIEAILKLGSERIRKDFPPKDPSEFDTSEMVILVVRRFLRYCIDKPSDEYRLRALALLRKRDDAALRAVWELPAEERPREILTDLEARYGFIQPGGILHDVVRQFLRDSMRVDDHDTAQRLSQLAVNYFAPLWESEMANLSTLSQRFSENRWLDLTRDLLNALCWDNDERKSLRFLAARTLEARVFNLGVAKGFIEQVGEFKDTPNRWGDSTKRYYHNLVQTIGTEQTEAIAGINALLHDGAFLGLNDMHHSALYMFQAVSLLGQGKTQEAFIACQAAQKTLPDDESLRLYLAKKYVEIAQEMYSYEHAEFSLTCVSNAIELAPQYYLPYLQRGRLYAHILKDYASAFEDFAKAIEVQPEEPSSHICRGCVYRSLRNYSDAITDQSKAIELAPYEAYSYENRGLTYSEEKNYPAALVDFTKAIELKPSDSDNYFNRGNIYYTLKNYPDALADFSKVVEFKPDDINAYLLRGQAHFAQKEYLAALADFSKVIELKPDDSNAYMLRGQVHSALKDFAAAITDFSKAIELKPDKSNNYSLRGQVFDTLKDYPAAIKDFDKAIELKPDDDDYYHIRAHTHQSQKDSPTAINDFTQAIKLSPSDSSHYHCRGECYFELGNHAAAVMDFSKAIELSPENNDYYFERGRLYSTLEDFPAALADFLKAIELKPEDSDNYFARGSIYSALHDYSNAIADFSKAIELMPDDSVNYHNRGGAYLALKDYPAALADCSKAIELKPEENAHYSARGLIYLACADYPAALADFSKAIKLKPEDGSNYCNRGDIYYKLRDYPAALADLSKAIELESDNFVAYNLRGIIYSYLNDYTAALADYNKIIEHDANDSSPIYNTACAYALQSMIEPACVWLRRAFKMSSKYIELVNTDTDFDSIRDVPEFKSLLKEYEPHPDA